MTDAENLEKIKKLIDECVNTPFDALYSEIISRIFIYKIMGVLNDC